MSRRMRLPNGFGQISKIKGKRLRHPWRAMVTYGQDSNGKYKRKILGYYETYNSAYEALIEYHKNPTEKYADLTMQDLFYKWGKEYFTDEHPNAEKMYTFAWDKCKSLYNMKVSEVRSFHLKEAMEADMPHSAREKVKSMLNLMFDYALFLDITDKNYARQVRVVTRKSESEVRHHIAFSDEELEILWENKEDDIVQMILIGCYTGFRPQELVLLENKNINLTEGYLVGGMKTKAGIDRKVPIHPRVKDFIARRMNSENKYLFDGFNYDAYKNRFHATRERLRLSHEHTPHDTRVTFVTNAKLNNMDEYAIKRIVGHRIDDLTERVYADRPFDWLIEEMNKLV